MTPIDTTSIPGGVSQVPRAKSSGDNPPPTNTPGSQFLVKEFQADLAGVQPAGAYAKIVGTALGASTSSGVAFRIDPATLNATKLDLRLVATGVIEASGGVGKTMTIDLLDPSLVTLTSVALPLDAASQVVSGWVPWNVAGNTFVQLTMNGPGAGFIGRFVFQLFGRIGQ